MSELKKNNCQSGEFGIPMFQENISNIPAEHFEKLEKIKFILCKRFPSLSIQQTISQDSVPFLHIWKPISKSSGVQGMPFLPCFHIIVTLSITDNENDVIHGSLRVLFQLHSFHGKVLKEDVIDLEQCDETTDYTLVQYMAKDKIQLCHGVEEIDCDKFKEFIKSCKLPLLSKIRSVFLIEQFMGSVVFRSRLCEFALENPPPEMNSEQSDIFVRCEECSSFQYCGATPSQFNDGSLTGQSKGKIKTEQNVFERVYYKTSVSDMEAMAVLHEVRKMYEKPLKNGNHGKSKKKRGRKLGVGYLTSAKGDVHIKTEPADLLCRQQTFNHVDSVDEQMPISEPEPGDNVNVNTHVYDNDAIAEINDHKNRHIKEEINPDEIPIRQQNENIASTNDVDEHVETHPISVNDLQDDSFQLQTDFKKKRGRPRKYHSRSDYLHSLEKRKERKKKETPLATSEVFDETCQICLYKFKNESCHRKDQERHEQALSDLKQPLFCPLRCQNQQISSKYELTSHFEEKHSEQNLTCCCECLELIPKGNNRLRQHILKTHHTAAVSLVCPDCGLKCAGNVQFQIHMAIKHSSEKSYMCQHCGIGFAHSKRLQVHLRRNHQPRDLQCPHCDKKFETRDQAIRHLVVHTGLKPYKCVQCQYSSYRQCNVMSVHFVKSHGRKGSQSDVLTDIAERDMMSEIAVAEVDEMLKNRKLNLKKEMKLNDSCP